MEEHEQKLLIYSQSDADKGALNAFLRAWSMLLGDAVGDIDVDRPLEVGQIPSPYPEEFPVTTCVRSRGGDVSTHATAIYLDGEWDADKMVASFNLISEATSAGNSFDIASLPTRNAIVFTCIEFHPDVVFTTDPPDTH